MKKMTTTEFIEKAIKKHGNKYDYSNTEYVNATTKVCIICPEHGEFWIQPNNHLSGQGCPKCGKLSRIKKRAKSAEQFIEEAKNVHGNRYDYSKVDYTNDKTKVCIICPEHGEFWQSPSKHLHGNGCPKCAGNTMKTTEQFIEEAKRVHGAKYDYSKVEYAGANKKVCIICPEHGEFLVRPINHLRGGGCPKCAGKCKTTEDFIKECVSIHGDKYTYENSVYTDAFSLIRVNCKIHGEFLATPHNLLRGAGCPKCANEHRNDKTRKTTEKFISEAEKLYGDKKYDYSKVKYVNAITPICIICQKHGEFFITPNRFLSKGTGCPKCNESSLEASLRVLLEENNINFEQQKHFEWLGLQSFDFYIPGKNLAIECQGTFHFRPFGLIKEENQEESLMKQINRDELKNKLSKENGVKLIYYVPGNLIKETTISKIYNENVYCSLVEILTIIKNSD